MKPIKRASNDLKDDLLLVNQKFENLEQKTTQFTTDVKTDMTQMQDTVLDQAHVQLEKTLDEQLGQRVTNIVVDIQMEHAEQELEKNKQIQQSIGASQMIKLESLVHKMMGELEEKLTERSNTMETKVTTFDEKLSNYTTLYAKQETALTKMHESIAYVR